MGDEKEGEEDKSRTPKEQAASTPFLSKGLQQQAKGSASRPSNASERPGPRKKKAKKSRFSSLRGSSVKRDLMEVLGPSPGAKEGEAKGKEQSSKKESPTELKAKGALPSSISPRDKRHRQNRSSRLGATMRRLVAGNEEDHDDGRRDPLSQMSDQQELPDINDGLDNASPFPGIALRPTIGTGNRGISMQVASSMPSKQTTAAFPNARPSIKQLRETLELPGRVVRSRKKYKNLASYALHPTQVHVSELDSVKVAPLLSPSKRNLLLEFSSPHSKLAGAAFLKDFPNNIKELDFRDNALTEFPPITHLSELRRIFLRGNLIETFSLEGLSGLMLLSLENNRLQRLPQLEPHLELVHLDLRGNKLEGGFDQLENFPNLELLDLSRCMLQMTKEEFESGLLKELEKLPKLRYLTVGDNPVLMQYPELQYTLIDQLSSLEYYDYEPITAEARQMAPLVRARGMDVLKQSGRATKEESRLNAELKSSRQFGTDLSEPVDCTRSLSRVLLVYLFTFLSMEDVATCTLVCSRWYVPANEIHRSRCSRILRSIRVVVGPERHLPKFASFCDTLGQQPLLAALQRHTTMVTRMDEKMLQRDKAVIFLVNKGQQQRDYWTTLYEQLMYRYCEDFAAHSEVERSSFHYLRYATFGIEDDTLAFGLDSALQLAGAKRVCPPGSSTTHSFEEWIAQVDSSLENHFPIICRMDPAESNPIVQ